MIIKTVLEFLVICLLIYGYTKEDKIAKWERKQIAKAKARLMSRKRRNLARK